MAACETQGCNAHHIRHYFEEKRDTINTIMMGKMMAGQRDQQLTKLCYKDLASKNKHVFIE